MLGDILALMFVGARHDEAARPRRFSLRAAASRGAHVAASVSFS
jgi:hypothetical protein